MIRQEVVGHDLPHFLRQVANKLPDRSTFQETVTTILRRTEGLDFDRHKTFEVIARAALEVAMEAPQYREAIIVEVQMRRLEVFLKLEGRPSVFGFHHTGALRANKKYKAYDLWVSVPDHHADEFCSMGWLASPQSC
ncbi:MAG: hypothetical protein V4674_01845 [Patescibacteria group bacterium]